MREESNAFNLEMNFAGDDEKILDQFTRNHTNTFIGTINFQNFLYIC